MSALDEIKKKLNHELTYIEYLIIENIDRETTSTINGAAAELADYELRLDLLAKGATWEHEENERLKDENAALRARVEKLEETGNKLVSLALSFNEDDPWIFERYDGVEIVSNAQNTLRGEA